MFSHTKTKPRVALSTLLTCLVPGAQDLVLRAVRLDGAEPHDAAHLHLLQVPLRRGPGGHLDIRIQIRTCALKDLDNRYLDIDRMKIFNIYPDI